MKKVLLLLLAIFLAVPALPARVLAETAAPAAVDDAPPVKKRYIIKLKDGGSVNTDSYTVENGKVKIMLPSGAISFERAMIKEILEVRAGESGETVQKSFIPSVREEPAMPKAPGGEQERPPAPAVTGRGIPPSMPVDDQGHTQDYWKARVKEWKDKFDAAQKRYKKAEDDWNRYNGLLGTAAPGTIPEFTQNQYLDYRGAARVDMDRASEEIAEAQRMLNEVIPDEARQAGAPPGWVR